MKRMLVLAGVAALSLSSLAWAADEKPVAKDAAPPAAEPKTLAAKFAYAIGQEIGASLKRLDTEIDVAVLARGIDDCLKDRKPLLTPEEAMSIKQEVILELQKKHTEKMDKAGEENKKAGAAFLEANGKKEGVKTTASGLQYKILREGKGAHPKTTDRVTVNYRGTLLDGAVFDSSYDRGKPVTFPLNRVIPGWTEGVQLMQPGAKFQFFIPGNLAYGEQGAGEQIGPNAALIFEVELLSIGETAEE